MKTRKLLSIVLALCLVVALAAGCTNSATTSEPPTSNTPTSTQPSVEPTVDNTVYKLNVSFAAPEFSTTEITAALDRIQEKSNGRIEFTYYYSWSLTSVPTCIDDLNSGVVDICAVPITEHLNLFPYSSLVTYTPFLGLPTILDAAQIYDELYDENPEFEQEYANIGLVYWTNYPCPGYDIFTTKDYSIRTPDDLGGLKLITSSSMMQKFIANHGGAAVSTPVTEYATSLNTNVVNGAINHANVMRAFGCLDFIKGATIFGEQGTAIALMAMAFSEQTWNKLPADLQQLFTDEAEALRDDQGGWETGAAKGAIASISEAGGTVITLTGDEIQVWRDAFEDLRVEYIDSLVSGGATNAHAIYDAVQAKIANRS